jgi:zinc transport system substrate-binding protein
MKKIISFVLTLTVCFCSAIAFVGCGNNNSVSENTDKLKIVATIFPYYDFAKNLAGDRAELKLLLSPGNEPHSYDPSPSDIVAIESCDIFIYNGGESDEWVESVLDSLQNKDIKILRMIDYVDPIFEQDPDHSEGDEYDEHIWTSPKNAALLSSAISDALVSVDEKNAEYYSEKENSYLSQLNMLDEQFREIVSSSKRNTVVFGDRFPFLYFVKEYGLDYECAFPGCSSETEPSITTVTYLIDYVKEEQIPVVFYLEFSNAKTANLIAEDTDAKTLEFYSCHNITKEQFENSVSYISLMQQNAISLEEALS